MPSPGPASPGCAWAMVCPPGNAVRAHSASRTSRGPSRSVSRPERTRGRWQLERPPARGCDRDRRLGLLRGTGRSPRAASAGEPGWPARSAGPHRRAGAGSRGSPRSTPDTTRAAAPKSGSPSQHMCIGGPAARPVPHPGRHRPGPSRGPPRAHAVARVVSGGEALADGLEACRQPYAARPRPARRQPSTSRRARPCELASQRCPCLLLFSPSGGHLPRRRPSGDVTGFKTVHDAVNGINFMTTSVPASCEGIPARTHDRHRHRRPGTHRPGADLPGP